jgi:hypothetical protein
MVIFEDDADIAITESYVNSTLKIELSNMTTDILYLGWCVGQGEMRNISGSIVEHALPHPYVTCSHAYAITRKAARILRQHFDVCGPQIDLQLAVLCGSNLLTFRTAFESSYKGIYNDRYSRSDGKFAGIFHQSNHLRLPDEIDQ